MEDPERIKHLLSGTAARYREAMHWLRIAKLLALFTFLVPFSALGAYAQYEFGNIPLMVMYLVLGPIVAAFTWLLWRNAIADVREERRPGDVHAGSRRSPGMGLGATRGDRLGPGLDD
jgi:uncharacterized membrane protein YfcA